MNNKKTKAKCYKILRTFCEGYENPTESKGYLKRILTTADQCRTRIEEFLEEVYGEEWKELHGDDIKTDDMGFPYYQTDIGDGGYEVLEPVEFSRKK